MSSTLLGLHALHLARVTCPALCCSDTIVRLHLDADRMLDKHPPIKNVISKARPKMTNCSSTVVRHRTQLIVYSGTQEAKGGCLHNRMETYTAAEHMMASLGDQWSQFLPPSQVHASVTSIDKIVCCLLCSHSIYNPFVTDTLLPALLFISVEMPQTNWFRDCCLPSHLSNSHILQ